MGDASDKLMKLRPVTFRYKADSTSTQQYGLIAEEVEKVYPELVIDDANGKAEMVTYQSAAGDAAQRSSEASSRGSGGWRANSRKRMLRSRRYNTSYPRCRRI